MNKWDELSMAEKNQLIGIYVSKGYRDLAAITAHYNSFAEGGRMDNPPDKDPVLKDRKPQANFYQRLLDKNRQTIPAWENRIFGGNTVATHRMSWATDANDNAIVYPEVQEINGKLYDFTDPRNKEPKSAARDRAIETGDTIMMTPAQANFWTQHYKEFYPSFDYATGGQMNTDESKEEENDKTYRTKQPLQEVNITADRPTWQRGLTDYDWSRARQYYSDENGYITPQGFAFLKNVASKRRTGKSDFMRDVDRLAAIPNAAMLGAGALSGAAFNPYLWTAVGLASGAQNIEDKNYKEAALDLGLTLGIPAAKPIAKMINTAVESTKFGKAVRTAAEINKATRRTKLPVITPIENMAHNSTVLNNIDNNIPTLDQALQRTYSIPLSHGINDSYLKATLLGRNKSFVIPSTALGYTRRGENVNKYTTMFLDRSVLDLEPQAYLNDGNTPTVEAFFGNIDISRLSPRKLNLGLKTKTGIPVSKLGAGEQISFDDALKIAKQKHIDGDIYDTWNELKFDGLIPYKKAGYAYTEDEEIADMLKRRGIVTNFDFYDSNPQAYSNFDTFIKEVVLENPNYRFKKGGQLK